MAGLSRRWILPGTGRTGRVPARAGARRTHHARPQAVRGLESRSRTGFRRTRRFGRWTLASATWSDAPARALSEFDRTLLYGLVLVLTGSVAARVGDLVDVAALDRGGVRRDRARRAADAPAARTCSRSRAASCPNASRSR